MDRFAKLHPIVHIVFFGATFVFLLSVNNPFFSAASLICGLIYCFLVRGKEALKSLKFSVIIMITVSLFNFLFAHYGMDVLFTIGMNEFTAEALFYGFNQGMVLSAVLLWFAALSRIADSERVIYFLRFVPKIALVFSMVLGFIPRFTKKAKDIKNARLALSGGKQSKNIKDRMKTAMSDFSGLITYSLESSIVTADSMSARGYNPKAQTKNRYKITVGDCITTAIMIIFCAVYIAEKARGNIIFVFDPTIYSEQFSVAGFVCFLGIEIFPSATYITEELLWKLSRART